ncbi:hypothetical protein [Paludibacterium purpuratum]|uniref:hypothetical protein n=1 Tax=Paludibacterium purpuratum TaxID=1144873 RepID=UPI00105F6003|nr:hypothetical protein [Paludibacterium purpuratum]
MKRIIKSALLGAAVNLGSSYFLFTIISVCYAAFLASHNVSLKDIYWTFYSNQYISFALVVGVMLDIFGGYTAAKFNNDRHVLAGMLSALPCLFIGLLNILNPLPNHIPVWFVIMSWLVVIPAGMLGGFLAKRLHVVPVTQGKG